MRAGTLAESLWEESSMTTQFSSNPLSRQSLHQLTCDVLRIHGVDISDQIDELLRTADEPKAECSRCRGSGEVKAMTQEHGPDDYEFDAECPDCKGVGVVDRATVPPSALQQELAVTNKLLDERNRLLDAIPECPQHGRQCVPHAIEWVQKRATVPPSPDVELVDFLQRWVWHAKERGFQWDSFTFDTKRPVREQLREQMQAGMNELQKGSTVTKSVE
jgi:hypothetical protein